MPRVTKIDQVDYNGCGVAAMAMVSGLTYREAKHALFGTFPDSGRLEVSIFDLQKCLTKLGFVAKITETPARLVKTTRMIVGMDWTGIPVLGHFVVWDPDKQRFLDPAHKRALKYEVYVEGFKRAGKPCVAVLRRDRVVKVELPVNTYYNSYYGSRSTW